MQCYFSVVEISTRPIVKMPRKLQNLGITLTKSSHTKDADGKPLGHGWVPIPRSRHLSAETHPCRRTGCHLRPVGSPQTCHRGNFSLQGRRVLTGTEQFIRNTQITCNHHVKESRICRTICRVCHGADAPIWHTCFCHTCTRYLRECKRTERVIPKGKQSFWASRLLPVGFRTVGKYLVYTDDRPNEKFCQYASVGDSYEHHSQFLKRKQEIQLTLQAISS